MWTLLLDVVFPPRANERIVRSLQEEDLAKLLFPKLVETTSPATITLLPYQSPHVRALIHECKYYRNKKAVALLSFTLYTFLKEFIIDRALLENTKMCIVPIPLSLRRSKERGYNQVALVTEKVALRCSVPHKSLLAKIRDTASQVSLSRAERLRNQYGAFAASPCVPGITYILVDDVLTTGATLSAAIEAMEKEGATAIVPITLAH